MEDLVQLIETCQADTRRLVGQAAAHRLANWRQHTESEHSLVEYVAHLLRGEHRVNGWFLDQNGGLSLERIVLEHRPDLFSEADRDQAKRTLGIA